MRIATLALTVAGLLITVPAAAVDRLVDDHPSGIPCIGGALPLHVSITAAVAAAAPGETILVCPGTYSELVLVDKNDLTLHAAGLVRLEGGPATVGSGFLVTADRVTLQGFEVSGFGAVGQCGIEVTGGDAADVRDNHVHHNWNGICVALSKDSRIRKNAVVANVSGMRLSGVTGVDVSGNIVRDNPADGIAVLDCPVPVGATAGTVRYNLVTGAGNFGIFASFCPLFIHHNTVRNDGSGHGISVTDSPRIVVTHNLVQSAGVGLQLNFNPGCTVSFNRFSFNLVGIEAIRTLSCTFMRNVSTRNEDVDCLAYDPGPTFVKNACGTEIPAGVWD